MSDGKTTGKRHFVADSDVERLLRDTDLPRLIEEICNVVMEPAGGKMRSLCPWHADTSPSLYVYKSEDGKPPHYHCHGCSAHGDAIKVLRDKGGKTYEQALVELARRLNWWPSGLTPEGFDRPKKAPADRTHWTPICPVPEKGLPYASRASTFRDWKGREPTHVHQVIKGGHLWGVTVRYVIPAEDGKKGRKETPTWTWCRSDDGREEWRMRGFEQPYPLYGLDRLTDAQTPVILHGGEKKTDEVQARGLFPGFANLSYIGGDKKVKKTDFSELAGRTVYLAPDADASGLAAQVDAASILHALGCTVHLIRLDTYVAILGDAMPGLVAAAEAEADKWAEDRSKWVFTLESGARIPAGWDLGDAPATWGEAEGKRILAEAVQVVPTADPLLADTDDQVALDPDAAKLPMTAIGLAQRIALRYGRDLRFDWSQQAWLVWTGTHWTLDRLGQARRWAMDTATRIALESPHRPAWIKAPDFATFANKSCGFAVRNGALADAAALDGISVADRKTFDADPWLLATPSSTIDLRTSERRKPCREDLITACCSCDYAAGIRHPTLDLVLDTLSGGKQEIKDYLQLALGASIVGGNRPQLLYVLVTKGGSGKTTLFEGIAAVMGQLVASIAQTTLLVSSADKIRSDIARLDCRRLVYCDEVKSGIQLDEWLIKWLTGGGTIVARQLHANEFEFRPRFTPWLLCNEPPRLRTDDTGIERRVVMLDLRQIAGTTTGARDASIIETLRDVRQTGPAILAWLVEGARRYHQQCGRTGQIPLPEVIRSVTADYLVAQDLHAEFFTDYVRQSVNAVTPVSDVRHAYLAWCATESVAPLGSIRFNQRLRDLGANPVVRKVNGTNTKCWDSLVLTDAATALPPAPCGSEHPENSWRARARGKEDRDIARAPARHDLSSCIDSHSQDGSGGSDDISDQESLRRSQGLDLPPEDLAGF